MAEDAYIAALKRERAAYEAAGKNDRAAQVTAELERVGAEETVVEPVESAPDRKRTRGGSK